MIYIDIDDSDDFDEPIMATFKDTGPSKAVDRVRLELDTGWTWCAVTGRDGARMIPARCTPIEESGDGPAILIHGGKDGLRLQALSDRDSEPAAWDEPDTDQWAEGFLICRPHVQLRGL